MAKFYSEYTGEQLDEAIAYYLQQKESSATGKIIESSSDHPVDPDSFGMGSGEGASSGTYVIDYMSGGYDESNMPMPVVLDVVVLPDGTVSQSYNHNGTTVYRVYDSTAQTWSSWKELISAITMADEDEEVPVTGPTVIFRKINDVEAFFAEEEEP